MDFPRVLVIATCHSCGCRIIASRIPSTQLGLDHAKRNSWDKTAKKTLDVYCTATAETQAYYNPCRNPEVVINLLNRKAPC